MSLFKKQFRIRKKEDEIEPQEVFLDALVKKSKEPLAQFEVPLQSRGPIILGLLALFVFLLIFIRLLELQIFSHQEFQALATKNQFFYKSIQSQRGIIYDRSFTPLVLNKPSFDLMCDTQTLKTNQRIIQDLTLIFNIQKDKLLARLNEAQKEEFLVKENLEYQELIRFEGLSEKFPGCHIERTEKREYLDSLVFAHVLGYWRKNGPNEGLEQFYDEILKSQPGKVAIERDAKGNVISEKVEEFPKPGKSLVLWLSLIHI